VACSRVGLADFLQGFDVGAESPLLGGAVIGIDWRDAKELVEEPWHVDLGIGVYMASTKRVAIAMEDAKGFVCQMLQSHDVIGEGKLVNGEAFS
jgi:hypothetical protein